MKLQLIDISMTTEKEAHWDVEPAWVDELLQEGDPLPLFGSSGPLSVSAWLYRNEEEVFFRAELKGKYTSSCVRCLEQSVQELDFEFSGLFRPRKDGEVDEPEDPAVFLYQSEEVDFHFPVREHIYLQLPINPVCREDCAGLCPDCGVNRNESSCECKEEKIDPRWDVLRQLRDASGEKPV